MRRPGLIHIWRSSLRNHRGKRLWLETCQCGYGSAATGWEDAMSDAERHIKARHTDDTTTDVIG